MINPSNHYWIIAGSSTERLFERARIRSSRSTDTTYADWTANNTASEIASMAELYDVSAAQYPAAIRRPITPTRAIARQAAGDDGGNPYLTDPVSRNTVASAHDYAVANPGHMTEWKLANGTFIPLDEPGLAHVLAANGDIRTIVFHLLRARRSTSINSGGTLTTIAQIDAVYTAISTVLA